MSLKVIITDCVWHDNSIEAGILQEAGFQVERAQCTTPAEIISACSDADALLVGWAPLNREAIASLKRCRLMMRYGAGYNNIDVEAASSAGIAVAINADYCVEEVATHALALLLACHRQLPSLTHSVRSRTWDPMTAMRPMPLLSSQVAGIIGMGRIGRSLAEMLKPLVSRVLAYDPPLRAANTQMPGVDLVDLDGLLADSDYVSIHAPLGADTHHLFSRERLARMKQSAYLINCARGPLVDEDALVEALQAGRLAGAGLDVFATEPLPMDHALRAFPNVIITPHAAWYSAQSDYLLRANPARGIVQFFRGENIPLVNRPAAVGA